MCYLKSIYLVANSQKVLPTPKALKSVPSTVSHMDYEKQSALVPNSRSFKDVIFQKHAQIFKGDDTHNEIF